VHDRVVVSATGIVSATERAKERKPISVSGKQKRIEYAEANFQEAPCFILILIVVKPATTLIWFTKHQVYFKAQSLLPDDSNEHGGVALVPQPFYTCKPPELSTENGCTIAG
jgi:hypothetical protein